MTDKRQKYQTRAIILYDTSRDVALAMVRNAPDGVEIVAREPVKARKPDQNALYWAGPLKDIETQAWVECRQYRDIVWHEMFKRDFLPDDFIEEREYLAKHVKNPDTYQKWVTIPGKDRVCAGSTTDLTPYGFGQYLEQVYAYGASLGVLFSANPRSY